MARVMAVVFAALGLFLAFYLVALLYLIRRRGYGEGRRIEVPEAGIAFRCPGWWRELAVSHEGAADGSVWVQIRTGNHRGTLTVGPVPTGGLEARSSLPPGADADGGLPPLWIPPSNQQAGHPADQSAHPPAPPTQQQPSENVVPGADRPGFPTSMLVDFLALKGFVLDDVQIVTGVVGPSEAPSGSQAWIASNGRETPQAESRSYFEIHIVEVDAILTLFVYTNSVLHGFLDAFYLERILGTIEPLPAPPSR